MSCDDAVTDVRAIRTVFESILKKCDRPHFDPHKHDSLASLRSEIERANELLDEVHSAIFEALRVDVAEAEESVRRLDRNRDLYRNRCEEYESCQDKRIVTGLELAEAVTEFIGHISADESLAIHNIRMLAHDVKEAA